MKKTLLPFFIFLLVLSVGLAKAQGPALDVLKGPDGKTLQKARTWSPLLNQNQLLVNYKFDDCNLPSQGVYREFITLQLVNPTPAPITIEYDLALWYNNNCVNCDAKNAELHFVKKLAPSQTLEGNCETRNDQALSIFSRLLDMPEKTNPLSFFELKNLKITVNQ